MANEVQTLKAARHTEQSRSPCAPASLPATGETEIDSPWFQGWAYEALVTVVERAGRIDEAREALEHSLALWERNGCLPCAQRVRDQIGSLGMTNA